MRSKVNFNIGFRKGFLMKRNVFYRAWSGFLWPRANRSLGPESLVPLGSGTPGSGTPGTGYPWDLVPLWPGTPAAWDPRGLGPQGPWTAGPWDPRV